MSMSKSTNRNNSLEEGAERSNGFSDGTQVPRPSKTELSSSESNRVLRLDHFGSKTLHPFGILCWVGGFLLGESFGESDELGRSQGAVERSGFSRHRSCSRTFLFGTSVGPLVLIVIATSAVHRRNTREWRGLTEE